MIIDCPNCQHLYDVSKYKVGQKLRCRCGQIIIVSDHGFQPRAVKTLHCSNCGGELIRGQEKCPYCDALVDLTSSRLNAYCTWCLAFSKEDAKYCSGCGEAMLQLIDKPTMSEQRCPRCEVRFRRRDLGNRRPLECPMCCGLFIEADAFEDMLEKQTDGAPKAEDVSGPDKARLDLEKVVYLKCPECSQMMNRANYGEHSGVMIDYCVEHGYWLDAGELERIAAWVRSGGLLRKYAFGSEEKLKGKVRFSKVAKDQKDLKDLKDSKKKEPKKTEEVDERLKNASILDLFLMSLFGD